MIQRLGRSRARGEPGHLHPPRAQARTGRAGARVGTRGTRGGCDTPLSRQRGHAQPRTDPPPQVLSEEEEDGDDDDDEDDDEEDDDDAPEEAARSPHPSIRTRRSELGGSPPSWGTAGARCQRVPATSPPCPPAAGSMLHGRSDSSGFGEEPVPASAPPARPRGPDWVT